MLCAICDVTNETNDICAACKADPVNEGWGQTWEALEGAPDSYADRDVAVRLADLIDSKRSRPLTPLQLAIGTDLLRGGFEAYVYRDGLQRRRGVRRRRCTLSTYSIAARHQCSQAYVSRWATRLRKASS